MPTDPFTHAPRSVPQAILDVVEDLGIEMVFVMPGGNMVWSIVDALRTRPRLRTVLVREEVVATVMAQVYARLTGRPGVAIGQAAWILGGGALGILEARMSGSPMLVLTELSDGAPFTHHGFYQAASGAPGGWDAGLVSAGIASHALSPRTAIEAVQQTQLAGKYALSGGGGPAVMMYHSDALKAALAPDTVPAVYATAGYLTERRGPDPEELARLTALIAAAKRPVVIAGNGVRASGAQAALMAFASELDLPVVTTAGGKGVFPESDERSMAVFGTYGRNETNMLVAAADLVIAVGTRLGPTDTAEEDLRLLDPGRQTFVQLEIDETHAAWTYPMDAVVVGDARKSLELATAALAGYSGDGRDRVDAARRPIAEAPDAEVADGLRPSAVVRALRASLPDNAIVTSDAGENRLHMIRNFETRPGGEYLMPTGIGGMGYAIPAALAAKLVHTDRRVVAVCGDGGISMSFAAVLSAVENELPVTVVVLNNSALGWVLNGQENGEWASRYRHTDFAAMARGAGAIAHRCESLAAVRGALAAAAEETGPTVIDVVVSLGAETYRDITWSPDGATDTGYGQLAEHAVEGIAPRA